MPEEYMKDATATMVAIMGIDERRQDFQAGRMAMGLELVGIIRTLDGIPSAMTPAETASVVSVIETLLVQQELTVAYEVYDRISAARRPVFLREPSPEDIARVSDDLVSGRVARSPVDASQGEVLAYAPALQDRLRALAEARRSLDASTNDESTELTDSLGEELPSESGTPPQQTDSTS